jgi:DNA-binding NarL/FixJ family response regulator
MTISISGPLPVSPAPESSTTSAGSNQPAQKKAAAPDDARDDTVRLSQTAQVHQLKQAGQSVSQIASNLSISAATVDGYLNITVPKTASTPTPAPTQSTSTSTPAAPTKGA